MMGQLNRDQEQLFYSFRLDEVVPDDHLVRAIAAHPAVPEHAWLVLRSVGLRLYHRHL